MDFNLDNFLSQILYVLSGFLFGIFASRYSVLSWRTIRARGIFASLLQVCILLIAFIAFPLLFFSAAFFYPYGNGQLCILRCFAFLFQQGLQQEVKL